MNFIYKEITLLIYLTDKCNMNCSYCYNNFPRNNIDLEYNTILNYIDDINLKTDRNISVLFIGGEPTLHKNLYSIVTELRKRDFIHSIEIFTNFSMCLDYYESLIKFDVKLVCSWHDEINDEDFINKLILSSTEMKKNIVEISMMFEPSNIKRWENIIEKIKNEYSEVIKLWILYNKENIFEYTDEQKRIFSKTAITLKKADLKNFLNEKNIYNSIFDSFVERY